MGNTGLEPLFQPNSSHIAMTCNTGFLMNQSKILFK